MTKDDSEKPHAEPQLSLTGQALIDAMQASPHRDIDIEPERLRLPLGEYGKRRRQCFAVGELLYDTVAAISTSRMDEEHTHFDDLLKD